MPKISIYTLLIVMLMSLFGGFVFTTDPFVFSKDTILLSPSLPHPFGTDRLGRDMLARIIEGGQISLFVGFASALVSTLLGLMVGVVAGYKRGLVDKAVVAIIDLFLTVPTFFLLLALVAYMSAGALMLIIIISISSWMGTARLVRSEVFAINKKPFIKILKVASVPTLKIMLKYYAPILSPILLVNFTFGVGGAILAESSLSFLGLGITPPDISWGSVLSDGKDVMDIAWWVSFFPGLMIFAVTYTLVNIANFLQAQISQKTTTV
jgi:peptide/nickel transport system permease protein